MAISTISSAGLATGAVGTSQLATASVDSTILTTAVQPIGVGQTWTDVKASRAINTTYTNSTGRPIFVAIQFSTASSVTGTLTIAGVAALNNSANAYYNALFGIVPSGATYVLSGVPTISTWCELR